MALTPVWMLWRFGERCCAACGSAEVAESVEFPPAGWVTFEGVNLVWWVPVCAFHRRVSVWPLQSMMGLRSEIVAVEEGRPTLVVEMTVWEWAESVKGPSDSEGAVAIP